MPIKNTVFHKEPCAPTPWDGVKLVLLDVCAPVEENRRVFRNSVEDDAAQPIGVFVYWYAKMLGQSFANGLEVADVLTRHAGVFFPMNFLEGVGWATVPEDARASVFEMWDGKERHMDVIAYEEFECEVDDMRLANVTIHLASTI